MKLAVLLSSYNGEKYIKEQIDSILDQKGDFSLDLWVRDDGSTDSTPQILETYAQEGKLNWYTGPNLKPAKSFMDLLLHCPGYDYYAFADQDDYWYPEKLQVGLDLLKDCTGPSISFANARLVDGALNPLGRNVYKNPPRRDFYSLVYGSNIIGCTMVLNSALVRLAQEKPMPADLFMHDYYMLNLCTLYDGTVVYDPNPHMDYRQHGGNVIGAKWTKADALKDRIRRITTPAKVSIATQSQSLYDLYPQAPSKEKLDFLKQVAEYKRNCFTALALACSRKPRCNSKNMAVTIRLSYLLRNR